MMVFGYIEKKYGTNNQNNYVWIQCMDKGKIGDFSLVITISNMQIKNKMFLRYICNLSVFGTQYRFETYNGSKIVKYEVNDNMVGIELKKGNKRLLVWCEQQGVGISLNSVVRVTLYQDDICIFEKDLDNATSEVFYDIM